MDGICAVPIHSFAYFMFWIWMLIIPKVLHFVWPLFVQLWNIFELVGLKGDFDSVSKFSLLWILCFEVNKWMIVFNNIFLQRSASVNDTFQLKMEISVIIYSSLFCYNSFPVKDKMSRQLFFHTTKMKGDGCQVQLQTCFIQPHTKLEDHSKFSFNHHL